MKEALFYTKLHSNQVKCDLCPHVCIINDGATGNCKVRTNNSGILYADNYGKISGYHLDPLEKKPLYHYFPGKYILSVGSFGCNMHCKFCQNFEISQCGTKHERFLELSPDSLANEAMRKQNNIGIAYTYNEPLVFYEFIRDTALLAKQMELKNVMVSNGYFNPAPLEKMLLFIDAFSIDLKAFTDDFYQKYTSSHIEAVKESLIKIKKAGKHLEITNLVIPGLNDQVDIFKDMLKWIVGELGKDTVLHISRYFPRYKLSLPQTGEQIIEEFYHIAKEFLDFVYIGNLQTGEGQNTLCPDCKQILIKRNGYFVTKHGLNPDGSCSKCGIKALENI
jgi:pyruvate formate lyase activating enzyme